MSQEHSPQHPEHDVQPSGEQLSAPDAAAVDALVDAGFEVSRVSQAHRERAARVLRLMDGLDSASAGGEAGAEAQLRAVMARIAQGAGNAGTVHSGAIDHGERTSQRGWIEDQSGLSKEDIEALEALLHEGLDPSRVSHGLRARAEHQAAILSLLGTQPGTDAATAGADREAMIQRTLGAVQAGAAEQRGRMTLQPQALRRGRSIRWADFASVAAILLVGAMVLVPMVSSFRESGRRTACNSNFAAAGIGFASYSNDYKDSMPMASASLAGTPWWFVGKPEQSNSANLYTLAAAKYLPSLEPLTCPGCTCAPRGGCQEGSRDWRSMDEVSYSFQNLFSTTRPRWNGVGPMVVLADRSPITLGSVKNEPQNPFANSPNHGGTGQNVLLSDGSAKWMRDPVSVSGGDIIWLPREIEMQILADEWAKLTGRPVLLIGKEEPGAAGNVFLGP